MKAPRAAFICIGSELLSGQINTHQAWWSLRLRRAGFDIVGEESVPDDLGSIRGALRRAANSADVTLVSGGLGPTFDDITREAAAAAFGRKLHFDPKLWKAILSRFARYHVVVPEENKRQAMRLKGAKILSNSAGSAPGQWLRVRGRSVVLLPGPPTEMYPMFEAVWPKLVRLHAGEIFPAIYSIRLSGVPESVADERLDAVRARWPRVRFTILASGGEISFHASALELTAAAAKTARARLRTEIRDAVQQFAHGEDDASLEVAVGERLLKRRLTLAVAESCTGGLLGGRLTSVPGSSRYFLGGVMSYANSAKINMLGIPARLIARHGAVSKECAIAMAQGARKKLGADLGLSITGIACPGGGTKDKPVGRVYIAVSGPERSQIVRQIDIHGSRETIRGRAVTAALRLAFDAVE